MADEKEFQKSVQRISGLVHELDSIADPALRAASKELVQLLLDLHATGLERALEVVANDELGQRIIDDLGRDPLVSSLLVLYGLHPLDLDSRVVRAVQAILPQVRKGGGELQLIGIKNGAIRLHLHVTGHSCGSTGKTLKTLVEDAIYEAAPDMNSLLIEGLEEQNSSSGFVPLTKLGVASAPASIGQP